MKNPIKHSILFGYLFFVVIPYLTIIINNGLDGLILDFGGILTVRSFQDITVKSKLLFGVHIAILLAFVVLIPEKRYNPKILKISKRFYFVYTLYILSLSIYSLLLPNSIIKWNDKIDWFLSSYGYVGVVFILFLRATRDILIIFVLSANRPHYYVAILPPLLYEMYFTGNRIFLVSLGLAFLLLNWRKMRYKIAFIILSLPVLLIFIMWSTVRGLLGSGLDMSTAAGLALLELTEFNPLALPFQMSEGANMVTALNIYQDYHQEYNLYYGITLFEFIFSFMGFSFDSPSVLAAKMYFPHLVGFSLNTTFTGEMIMNFGVYFFSIASIVVIWILVRYLSQLGRVRGIDQFYSGYIIYMLPIFWRSNFSDRIIQMSIVLIGILIIQTILRKNYER